MVASDNLFYWLFQNQPDRILPLLPDLAADACGYRFSAPVLKEREYRLDEQRVEWIELLPDATNPTAPALVQALNLLLQSEQELSANTSALRARVAGTSKAAEIDDVIAELCAMGGITLDDFTQSVAYREIFGRGRQEGRQEGWQEGELDLALRLLQRRCGPLAPQQESRVRALPPHLLEALAGGQRLTTPTLDWGHAGSLSAWGGASRASLRGTSRRVALSELLP